MALSDPWTKWLYAMAPHRAGYADAADLEDVHITSKHIKTCKTAVQLIHTRDLSRQATFNLSRVLQLEHLQRDIFRAQKALNGILNERRGQYVYRPAVCPANIKYHVT